MFDAIVVGARLCRLADGYAACATGLSGPAGRPGDIPERYRLDALHLAAGRGVPQNAGGCWSACSPQIVLSCARSAWIGANSS